MSDAVVIATLAVLAGVLAADTTAAFQIMVSQPLVAGILAGLVIGDMTLGLTVGAALQLVWIGVLPVGAAPFPDGATASVVGVGTAWQLAGDGVGAGWALACGIVMALLAGHVGQRVVRRLRRVNIDLARMAEEGAERGSGAGVARAVAAATGLRVLAGALLVALFLAVEPLVAVPMLALPVADGFPTYVWAAPIAAATIAATTRQRIERWLLLAGFCAGLLAFVLTRGTA